jgi:hypothetical protein
MMKEIKKFGVLSVGRVFGILGLITAFIQIIILWFVYRFSPEVAFRYGIDSSQFALGTIVMNVAILGLVYFLVGLFLSVVYNAISKSAGGIKIDLAEPRTRRIKLKKKKK